MSHSNGRRHRAPVHGVLLLDKPHGITSQAAVSRVKALYAAAKAGHTGTLDPMATGLLPIALGEATKFCDPLLTAQKAYLASIRLGTTTTTGDVEGEITANKPVTVRREEVEAVLARFRGTILQVPPMYSALKHGGKPLYAYARAGIELPRPPRAVTIAELEMCDYTAPNVTVAVRCSKGTYIRVLAEDIGRALDCGACLAALRRTVVGAFSVENAVTLDVLTQKPESERRSLLLPPDAMVQDLPAVSLDPRRALQMARGQAVECAAAAAPLVRVYGPDEKFLGLAEGSAGGCLKPRRLVAPQAQNA